ncbi:hypothetical protein [Aneurinibacillus migulanus]|uniref:hypothetical protein n=1 Tax=Aneurinibacillus migulanus TaxID=47500 RepID=UPI000ACAE3A0|nr:hypothetical protein [Aneurinibacillus migulanus]
MNIQRIYKQEEISFTDLIFSIIDNEIDSIINSMYDNNKVNAAASHENEGETL